VQTQPPVITSTDCEGAGEVFEVVPSKQPSQERHFFREPKYLTVSSQLHLEALAQALGKVWTLSPTFRAERSDTSRHLSEFYMLEAELSFLNSLSDLMDVVESMLRYVASGLHSSSISAELIQVNSTCTAEDHSQASSGKLQDRWRGLMKASWPRITFENAVHICQDAYATGKGNMTCPPTLKSGLQADHEKFLAEHVGQNGPVFVTHYPRDLKAFYMSPSYTIESHSEQIPTVSCFDLLLPEICELVGGSLREHNSSALIEEMERRNISELQRSSVLSNDAEEYKTEDSTVPNTGSGSLQWYIDLRKYGSMPHGGFGMGFDRLLCYLSGVSNVRDTATFPRYYGRCDC
jgi:asparaginyl-tRNA synthetase